MAEYPSDHFFDQFQSYPQGEQRFKAVARHAAMLLNSSQKQEAEERDTLVTIRDALIKGTNPVLIALAIQERLRTKFDTWADIPTIEDL